MGLVALGVQQHTERLSYTGDNIGDIRKQLKEMSDAGWDLVCVNTHRLEDIDRPEAFAYFRRS